MKKFFVLLIVFCFISPVFAEIKPPDWSEFCPQKYLNAQYQKVNKWDYWFNFSKEENNYWASRKISFEKQLKYCDSSIDKSNCFLLISQNEDNRNSQYKINKEMEISNGLNAYNSVILNGIRYGY